nr:MAG TPA: Helix-turn-helix XRE-family like protein [Caudoviricetes sp.]
MSVMIDIDMLLKERKLSKKEVAEKMGISREYLYKVLAGNPTLDNIQKLAGAIGISISELFESSNADKDVITCPNCGKKFKMIE